MAAFVRPSYISLPPWLFNDEGAQLSFHFRTKERNALVIFHGSYDADFLAIELKNGRLICHLNIGKLSSNFSSLGIKQIILSRFDGHTDSTDTLLRVVPRISIYVPKLTFSSTQSLHCSVTCLQIY